ncbi:MAG: hypothetical protein AAGN35_02690 [Bacteroidota bacterium]
MSRIIDVFLASQAYDETTLLKRLGVTKQKKNRLLDELGDLALRLIGNADPEGKLMDAVVGVRKLTFQMNNEGAIQLWRGAMAEAERLEKFEVIQQLHELAWIITTPFEHEAMSAETAIRKHTNCLAYLGLNQRLSATNSPDCTPERRAIVIQNVRNSPLMESPGQALSVRAQYLYWRIQLRLSTFSRDFAAAIRHQQTVTTLRETYPWIKQSRDFFFTRELIALSNLNSIAENYEEAERIIFQVGNLKSSEKRTEWEKLIQLYPYRIQLAIIQGNLAGGDVALQEILTMVKPHAGIHPQFVSQNLYFALYYCIAAAKWDEAGRLIASLRRFRQSEFIARSYEMYRLLEIILAFEKEDYDDIPRMIKNFRKLGPYKENRFFKLAAGVLSRCSNPGNAQRIDLLYANYHAESQKLLDVGPNPYEHWFDFSLWLKGKMTQRSMLDLFREQSGADPDASRGAI